MLALAHMIDYRLHSILPPFAASAHSAIQQFQGRITDVGKMPPNRPNADHPLALAFMAMPCNPVLDIPPHFHHHLPQVRNNFHISLRKMPQLPQKEPGYLLFIVLVDTGDFFVAAPQIPTELGSQPSQARGYQVAVQLLESFNNGLGHSEEKRMAGGGIKRPWVWRTNDMQFGNEVSDALYAMGVRDAPLVSMSADENELPDKLWNAVAKNLIRGAPLNPTADATPSLNNSSGSSSNNNNAASGQQTQIPHLSASTLPLRTNGTRPRG